MKAISPKTLAILAMLIALVSACSATPSTESQDDTPTSVPIGEGPDDENEIPCAPRAVLQKTCQQCHARPPKNDAPFPLVRRSDILKRGRNGIPIQDLVIDQLEARRMPLTPVTMDETARATLLAWVRGGSPGVSPRACTQTKTD